MIPASATVRVAGPARITALSYNFDLLTPDALLRRYLGREVGVVRTHPQTGEETIEKGTLLATEGGVVLRYRDRIETGMPGRLVFDQVPADLSPFPALTATVDSAEGGRQGLGLSYLTEGLSWSADYDVEVDDVRGRLSLVGRATVSNTTRSDFRNAAMGLIAGRIRRVSTATPIMERPEMMKMSAPRMAQADAPSPLPARETVGDLHLYSIARPVTIVDRETQQLPLLEAREVAVTRTYLSESAAAAMATSWDVPQLSHPEIRLRFDNAEKGGPGVPLPSGVARLFMRDQAGHLRLIGEDRINETPVGGTVELTPGQAFDITVLRRQTDFVRAGLPQGWFESAYRLELKNAKDVAVTVKVVEILAGDWKMLSESAPHQQESAERAVWQVPVPAKGSAELTYRVRIQH
jgi:hypothetical protein